MKLLAADIIICLLAFVTAGIEDDYKKEGMVPDIMDRAPGNLLQIFYENIKVELGKELPTIEVKDAPLIEWNFDPSKFYILILHDPDAPIVMREFLHWIVVNIPGNDFTKGDNLVEFMGAGPPKDSGIHRYTFNVYQQPGKITFDEKSVGEREFDGRFNFSLKNFATKYNLGDPISGNMFRVQYDDYVPVLRQKLGIM